MKDLIINEISRKEYIGKIKKFNNPFTRINASQLWLSGAIIYDYKQNKSKQRDKK